MVGIEDYITEEKIKHWFKKGGENKDDFDKFIYYWIAFNGFYCAYRQSNIGLKQEYNQFLLMQDNTRDTEKNQIKFVANEYKKNFDEVINKCLEINNFYDFLKDRCHEKDKNGNSKGGVVNLTRNETCFYSEKSSLEEFFLTIYTIRCNLFHGGKDPEYKIDNELILKATLALEDFLIQVLKFK